VNELNTNGGFYTEQEMKDILKWPVMLFLNLDVFPICFFRLLFLKIEVESSQTERVEKSFWVFPRPGTKFARLWNGESGTLFT